MKRMLTAARYGAIAGLLMTAIAAQAAEPEDVLTVRLVHPERQLEQVLRLFEGARAPHPAAALAAWRRANGGRGLSKSAEAVLALLNPETGRELAVLDGAELTIACDPDDGRLAWLFAVPHDDGTFAALATALVLTDGASEPPLGEVAIDRLGRPGSPVMARLSQAIIAAGSRADLARALAQKRPPTIAIDPTSFESGWLAHYEPGALTKTGPLRRRQAAEALSAAGCQALDARMRLEGETLRVSLSGRMEKAAPSTRAIDPRWLADAPAERLLAAFAIALDPSAEAWDAAFQVADRVEKVDPARAQVAPLRTRLNVAALAAKIQPEVDLWPKLVGLSGWVLVDVSGAVSGARIDLHAVDPAAAERLASRVLPALAASLRLGPRAQPPKGPGESVRLGEVSKRGLSIAYNGPTVSITWGELTEAAPGDEAGKSLAQTLASSWGPRAPQHVAAIWPWRLKSIAADYPTLANALEASPPVVWWGALEGKTSRDEIAWTALRGAVRRFLEKLPMAPEPQPADLEKAQQNPQNSPRDRQP